MRDGDKTEQLAVAVERAIVSSGYCNDPVVAEPGKYGFKGVVRKPYTLEGMVDVLNDVIGG